MERTDEVTLFDVSGYQHPRVPLKTWRESSSRRLGPAKAGIGEVEPLSCARCGHEMKIIFIIWFPIFFPQGGHVVKSPLRAWSALVIDTKERL